MKKYFVLIITLFGLFLSKSLFITNYISVSFNQNATQPIEYQFFWTDDNHENFSEHTQKKYTIKNNQTNVYIRIPNKKMKNFRLDTGIEPGVVEISDLKINGKSLDLNNFNKSADVESLVVENGKMIITSNKHDPYIVYKDIVNANGGLSINYPIFIILLCFWLSLSWFVVSFIYKKDDKIDAIFVLLFGILICIPMLHISNAKKSETENRMLATKPKLIVNNDINNKYGTQFNDWFNDRFLGRDILLNTYNSTKYIIAPNAGNDRVFVGKDGWLFSKSFSSDKMYQNLNRFSDEELEKIGLNMEKFVVSAKKIGVKQIYFVLDNDKESLYSEFYPSYVKKAYTQSRLEQLVEYMHKNYPNLKILNFYNQLSDYKKTDTLFYKTGTHMNNIGSFYSAMLLTDQIQHDFKKIQKLSIDDFLIQESNEFNQPDLDLDIYKSLNPRFYSAKHLKNKILVLKDPIFKEVSTMQDGHIESRIFINTACTNNIKVFAIGDSFLKRNIKKIAQKVRRIKHIYIGNGKPFFISAENAKDLYNNIPDIIIVQSTERFLQRFLELEFPKR